MKKNIQKYYHPSTTQHNIHADSKIYRNITTPPQHNIHADSKIPRAIKWSIMKADESALPVYLLTIVYGHNYRDRHIVYHFFVHSFVCLNVN